MGRKFNPHVGLPFSPLIGNFVENVAIVLCSGVADAKISLPRGLHVTLIILPLLLTSE